MQTMTVLEHNKKDLRVIQTPWGEEYVCAYCGGSVDWMQCENCDDGYTGHDCGEDCCCCLDPEPNIICDICDGKGGWYQCLSNCGKKAPTPIEIAAEHPSQASLVPKVTPEVKSSE